MWFYDLIHPFWATAQIHSTQLAEDATMGVNWVVIGCYSTEAHAQSVWGETFFLAYKTKGESLYTMSIWVIFLVFALVLSLEKSLRLFFKCGSSKRLLNIWSQMSTNSNTKAVHKGKSTKSLSERLQIIHTIIGENVTIPHFWELQLEFMRIPS